MARRYRLEYLKRKRKRELEKQKRLEHAQAEAQEEQPVNPLMSLVGWLAYIVIIVGVTYLLVTYVGQRTRVSGHSMEPSLHHNDNLIVDKITYRFRGPKRYEIIVFPYKHQENTFYIKRIIGLPGETVQIKDGEVYINGKLLGEEYGIEPIEIGKEGIAKDPIKLGKEEYFVLGDNRNHSADSRDGGVGVLHRQDIIGRAWIRIWPFKSIGVISHE